MTLKIATFAPIPSAIESSAIPVKPGVARNVRSAYRVSAIVVLNRLGIGMIAPATVPRRIPPRSAGAGWMRTHPARGNSWTMS
jgi:hypothetical protein